MIPQPQTALSAVLVAAEPAGGGGSAVASLLPFALLAVAFWFLLVRPQRKRAQEAAKVRAALTVGAQVMTTAGLYGTVAQVDDDSVLLEVAPGVTNRYAKAAVASVLSSPVDDADLDQTELDDETEVEQGRPDERTADDDGSDAGPSAPGPR